MNNNKALKLVITEDGSHTIFNPHIGEHYHSTFGAIQESEHIFIQAALDVFREKQKTLDILEIGFGTGLNALLSLLWADKFDKHISYYGLEAFPISHKTALSLNYHELLKTDQSLFLNFHRQIDGALKISDNFSLDKEVNTLENATFPIEKYDVIYFDAFSPEAQAELWTADIFTKLFATLKKRGVLTTYSCKGSVKRALKAAGFCIEKLPGPPGKREFLRATKTFQT